MGSPEQFRELVEDYQTMLEASNNMNRRLMKENSELKKELNKYERREAKFKKWLGAFYHEGW